MTAIITGIRNEKQLVETGVLMPGDMVMGCAPDESNFIADWDRIQTTWLLGQPYEGERVARSLEAADHLNYAPILISECFAIDTETGVKTNFVRDIDFTINGRFITWITELPQGFVYSLKYSTNFDWIAFVPSSDRYDRGINIGQKIYLRKRHIVFQHP
jgi:hypothetical protein